MIRFHNDSFLHSHWIGVDLNTTGHAVVAADLVSGKVMKLGKKQRYARTSSTTNCTKLYREGKFWKLKKVKSREKKEFRAALHKIARQIVHFAESSCAGIKFEKLFSYRYLRDNEIGIRTSSRLRTDRLLPSSTLLKNGRSTAAYRSSTSTRPTLPGGAAGAAGLVNGCANVSSVRSAGRLCMPI